MTACRKAVIVLLCNLVTEAYGVSARSIRRLTFAFTRWAKSDVQFKDTIEWLRVKGLLKDPAGGSLAELGYKNQYT